MHSDSNIRSTFRRYAMIERLMKEATRFGEPEYSYAGKIISQATLNLSQKLDPEGKKLLSQLEEAYQDREAIAIHSAFQEGFCSAIWLALDILEYHYQSKPVDRTV